MYMQNQLLKWEELGGDGERHEMWYWERILEQRYWTEWLQKTVQPGEWPSDKDSCLCGKQPQHNNDDDDEIVGSFPKFAMQLTRILY